MNSAIRIFSDQNLSNLRNGPKSRFAPGAVRGVPGAETYFLYRRTAHTIAATKATNESAAHAPPAEKSRLSTSVPP